MNTLSDIAADIAANRITLARAADSAIRRQVAGFADLAKAVDYLLGCLELLGGALVTGESHPVDSWGHLPPMMRKIAIALWDANGRHVSRDELMSLCYFDRSDDPPYEAIIPVFISKLRKHLPPGMTITAAYGRGWRLDR